LSSPLFCGKLNNLPAINHFGDKNSWHIHPRSPAIIKTIN
jgi:hypothetical protein